jgi:uncharacterized membrane protein YphA (DoxX/SURF4 family)
MALTRKRAISSGVMQVIGGLLILLGAFASQSEGVAVWTMWIGSAIGLYFIATGGYRTRAALKLPRD